MREKELSAMRGSLQACKTNDLLTANILEAAVSEYGSDPLPQVTFIIVGKRHHFRFFPMDSRTTDSRGNDNLHAGFVVDQGTCPW